MADERVRPDPRPAWWPLRLVPEPAGWLPDSPRTATSARAVRGFTAAYLGLIVVRSLIHLLAPDGGAHIIAGIDIAVPGGANIVAMFAQWGATQLLLAAVLWVLLLRYPGLCPLVLSALLAEPTLRALAGSMKHVVTSHPAPGAVLNDWMLPLLGAATWLSLCPATRRTNPAAEGDA